MSSTDEHDQDWERGVLGRLDPAAHQAPPARGSARYTAILEAAMSQTTPTTRAAQEPSTAAHGAGRSEGSSSRRHPAPRRWALPAAAAGLAVAATVGFGALPGGTSTAYASYTAVPTRPSPADAVAQADRCARSWDGDVPAGGFTADDVLLAEQRGDASVALVRKGDGVVLCQDIDPRTPTGWMAQPPAAEVPADRAVIQDMGSTGEGQYAYSSVAGQFGPGVEGVDVILPDGTAVQASTAGGRWLAWWPGLSGGEVDAVRVVVHTTTGEHHHTPSELYAD